MKKIETVKVTKKCSDKEISKLVENYGKTVRGVKFLLIV